MSVSCRRGNTPKRRLRRPVDDELAPVGAVYFVDRVVHIPLQPVESRAHLAHLVLEHEHPLDPGQVQSQLGRQALDLAQPLEIGLGIEPRVPVCGCMPTSSAAIEIM